MILMGLVMVGCNAVPQTKTQSLNRVTREFSTRMQENLSGHYLSDCQETYYKGLRFYGTSTELFQNLSYERTADFYQDANCQIAVAGLKEDGSFQFYDYHEGEGTHWGLAIELTLSYFRPLSQQFATYLMTANFLGLHTWQNGIWSTTNPDENDVPQELGPEADDVNVLIRTECSTVNPHSCVQVRLVK